MSRCSQGKPCGSTCISRIYECLKDLPVDPKGLSQVSGVIQGGKEKIKEPPVSEESQRAAEEIHARYAKAEPEITKKMKDLASKNGVSMHGLEYRLKDLDSIARKVELEKERHRNANRAAKFLTDISRYTMSVPTEDYGKKVKSILAEFEKDGYKVNVKNHWSKNAGPYRGLNVRLISPDGNRIELQLHTPRSMEIKDKIHPLYTEFRSSKDNKQRLDLWNKMTRLSESIPMPKGAMGIGEEKDIVIRKFEPID